MGLGQGMKLEGAEAGRQEKIWGPWGESSTVMDELDFNEVKMTRF